MPSIICPKCVIRLKLAFDFVQLAHASEKKLKAFLARISSDFQELTKITTSVSSASPLPADDHDEILTLLEETVDNNSNTMKLDSSTTLSLQTSKLKVIKLEAEEKPQFKQYPEFPVDEEKNYLTKSATGQNQINGYLEEFVMAAEQDASSYNEKPSMLCIYENTMVDEGNYDVHDIAMELEIEMHEEPAPSSSLLADEALKLYEDTEEELPNETNENLISTENVEHVEDKDYLHLELSDDEPASVVLLTKSDDLHPIEIRNTKPPTIILPLKQINTITGAGETSATKEEGVTAVVPRTSQKVGRVGKISSSGSSTNARFFCVKCNRDFSTKPNLTRHMATHEGIKPYRCTECNKNFSQNSALKQHMYTHTGQKRFICEVCDRGFTQYKTLDIHMRRHTGEKPFPCEHCGIFFRQRDGLKAHILKYHMIRQTDGDTEILICVICETILATKYALQVHIKKHINYHRFVPHNSTQGTLATADNSFLDLVGEDDLVTEKALNSEELALNIDDVTSSTQVLDTVTANTKACSEENCQCTKCYKSFAIRKNLQSHLFTHDVNVSELSCQVAFDTNYALRVNEFEPCNVTNSNQLSDYNNAVHDATG